MPTSPLPRPRATRRPSRRSGLGGPPAGIAAIPEATRLHASGAALLRGPRLVAALARHACRRREATAGRGPRATGLPLGGRAHTCMFPGPSGGKSGRVPGRRPGSQPGRREVRAWNRDPAGLAGVGVHGGPLGAVPWEDRRSGPLLVSRLTKGPWTRPGVGAATGCWCRRRHGGDLESGDTAKA